ncbi:Calcium-activated chloride channel [Novymonas esmeraldas]|uniref:Calcium-activated chloride channel n=1 Tax=Novymonas esmeraldas TaxID=1808958 RepID=A0AAW0EM28_9TRYP
MRTTPTTAVAATHSKPSPQPQREVRNVAAAAPPPPPSPGVVNAYALSGGRGGNDRIVGATVHVDPPKRSWPGASKPPPPLGSSAASTASTDKTAEIVRQRRRRLSAGAGVLLNDAPRIVTARASISLSPGTPHDQHHSRRDSVSGHSSSTRQHSASVAAPSVSDASRTLLPYEAGVRQQQRESVGDVFLMDADGVSSPSNADAADAAAANARRAAAAADARQQLGQPHSVALAARQLTAERRWKQEHSYENVVKGLHERLGITATPQTPSEAQPALSRPMEVVADIKDKVVALRRAEMAEMVARLRRMMAEADITGVPIIPAVSVDASGTPCPSCQYCITMTSKETIAAHLIPALQAIAGARMASSVSSSHPAPRCFRVELVPFGLHRVSVHVSVHDCLAERFFIDHAQEQRRRLALAIDAPFPEDWARWTNAHQMRLLHGVLDELLHGGAAPIIPATATAVALFPAHVDAIRDALWRSVWVMRSWTGWMSVSEDAVAAYFGEEVMFYYAWMSHYARWLLGAGVLGMVVALLDAMRHAPGSTPPIAAAAASLGGDGGVHHVLDVSLLPLFSIAMIVGGVVCIKTWERRCNTLCMRYHLFQQEVKDEPQHDFRGVPGADPVTGAPQLCYPAWYRAVVLQPLAWAAVTAFIAGTLAMMVCSLNLDGMVGDPSSWLAIAPLRRLAVDGGALDKAVHPVMGMLPPLGYSVCIAVFSHVFTILAKYLTRVENYRYRGEYMRALTLKRVVFEFVNSYAKLFFIAFGRGSMSELAANLRSILYVAMLTRLMSETVLPFMLTHRHRVLHRLFQMEASPPPPPSSSSSSTDRAPRPSSTHGGSSESPLDEVDEMLDTYDIYLDSIEMMIQFGHILLFAVAYPPASFVALLSNLVEVRSDLFKMCYVVRRPVPRLGVQQTATWCGIMRGFAIAAVIANTLLLAFTSRQMERWFPQLFTPAHTSVPDLQTCPTVAGLAMVPGKGHVVVLYSMVMEHVMGCAAVFLLWRIPSTPRAVRHYKTRRLYERMGLQ